jgi:hypothetical protein
MSARSDSGGQIVGITAQSYFYCGIGGIGSMGGTATGSGMKSLEKGSK